MLYFYRWRVTMSLLYNGNTWKAWKRVKGKRSIIWGYLHTEAHAQMHILYMHMIEHLKCEASEIKQKMLRFLHHFCSNQDEHWFTCVLILCQMLTCSIYYSTLPMQKSLCSFTRPWITQPLIQTFQTILSEPSLFICFSRLRSCPHLCLGFCPKLHHWHIYKGDNGGYMPRLTNYSWNHLGGLFPFY